MAGTQKRHPAAFKARVALEAEDHRRTRRRTQSTPVQISQWKQQFLDSVKTLFHDGPASIRVDPNCLGMRTAAISVTASTKFGAWVRIRSLGQGGTTGRPQPDHGVRQPPCGASTDLAGSTTFGDISHSKVC
jgi:hypothetical protein